MLCNLLLKVFDKMRQPYDLIELDQVDDSEQIQDALGKMTGARTVIHLITLLVDLIVCWINVILFLFLHLGS